MNCRDTLYIRVEKPCIIGEISTYSCFGEYISGKANGFICDGGEGITIAWNTSGKVKSVTGGSSPLDFFYSASGQRQMKAYLADGAKASDYYIHDATGNIMAIYTLSDNYSRFQLKERHIYGSSRLGIYNRNIEVYPSEDVLPLSFTRGVKRYELSNHLGNVNTVISDRKIQFKGGYMADIKSYVDYYPFGYQIPERTWSSSDYRFGFNGQEKDDEIYGEGNSTTAEYWQYDARLGRRWNVDPVLKPWESSYATFSGNPVWYNDTKGDCVDCPDKDGKPTIAIDAGHGIQGNNNSAMDPGAVANGQKESDLALNIAERVNAYLISYKENTLMIREGELTVEGNSLVYRTNKAKEGGADVFISIHINAAINETARGFDVLYKDDGVYRERNEKLARSILKYQSTMPIRGDGKTVRNDLSVLNRFSSTGAAVMIEVGFITNADDVKLMLENAESIGREIAKGIYMYTTGDTPPTIPSIDSSLPGY